MMREKWLNSFGPDKEVIILGKVGDLVKYLTRDKPKGDFFGRAPAFHVWNGDKWLYCGPSEETANRIYAEARDADSKSEV